VMVPGYNVCDDGNLINGDGCSSACIVEVGYRCKNGSTTTKSICIYTGS
jgi:cysteine-rich repeat protein